MENQLLNTSQSFDAPLFPLLQSFNTHFEHSFHDSSEEIDEDRCYLMEIQQLKRENNFLKKKIAEMSKRHPALTHTVSKRKTMPAHIKPAQSITSLPEQNYIVSFFDEVIRLLQSFSELFKVTIASDIKQEVLKQQNMFDQMTKQNPSDLNRKLRRMLLQPEEKRYGQLLNIFETYYKESTEKSKNLKTKIEHLTTEAIDLGKKMAQNVRNRQKIRGSRILSVYNEREQSRNCDQCSVMKQSFIKSTWTQSQLDLSECKLMLSKDKLFENIF